MTMQQLRVSGLRLRVSRSGEGPPLLLINGIGASIEMWSPLLPHLPAGEVIAFDLPGAGHSSVPCAPLRMRATANVVAELLDQLDVARADVLGYSFGGIVAQELAYRHPARVDRLILAATAAGWPSWPPRPHVAWLMMTPARYSDRRLATAIIPIIAGGRTARDRSLLRDSIDQRLASPPSMIGYFHQLYAVTGWTSQLWLGRLNHQTLVLHGDGDPIVPVLNARVMARRIPQATLSELPRAGHMLLVDEPERSGAEIRSFLNRDQTNSGGRQ
jgi:poly(3-hydroxyalkanoate) depolymerase